MNIKKINITIVLLLIIMRIIAQEHTCRVNFDYDESGNRTKRNITVCRIQNPTTTSTTQTTQEQLTEMLENKTAIKEFVTNPESDIKVYPNPVENKLNIDFIGNFAYKGTSFQIYDGSGKLYQQSTINNAKTSINFAQANAGNYFLVIENNEGKRFWWKIVKR